MSTNERPQRIVVLTGAGISAESGIKTFRASDGLWEEHRIEDVATPEAFVRDPVLVHSFYNGRRRPIAEQQVQPNQAHYALAKLEQSFNGDVLVVTQNIDDLHERAGSKKLLHMHGEILKAHCVHTERVFECTADLGVESVCDCCGLTGSLRPHIVWFGEMPLYMDEIYIALQRADIFAAIGTSGNVYPAAGFAEYANQNGAHCVELNLEPSLVASQFDEHLTGLASETVPRWVDSLLTQ